MKAFALSLRMLRREWRAGELRVLAASLVIAVGSVTSVGFFTDRVHRALTTQANVLLGADLVVVSDHPLDPAFEREAARKGLRVAHILNFPSMVVREERTQLAEVKAVDRAYPLRGRLRIAKNPAAPGGPAEEIPKTGTVWLEKRLFSQLGIEPGESLELGGGRFTAAAVIVEEPDRAAGLFQIAPRLLMNLQDLPATGLIQEGSRISYRLLVAGKDQTVEEFRAWAKRRLGRGEHIESVADARPEVRSALSRAERFLGLAALTSVVLAAVAVVMAARRFMLRQLDGCAVMRCLGASQPQIVRLYVYQFAALGLAASLAGCAVGFAGQEVLAQRLGTLLARELPLPSPVPAVQGVLAGMLTLFGFSLPFLLRLKDVPALRVLRREIGPPKRVSVFGFGLGIAAVSGLLVWQAGEITLGAYVLSGLAGAVALASLLALSMVSALRRLRAHASAAWRYGLSNIARRTGGSVAQTGAFSLGILMLLLLGMVRGDLLKSWQSTLPENAPNRFVINIQPDQLEPLRRFFQGKGMEQPAVFPMVRGRLLAINDREIRAADFADEHAQRLVEREFNLSWAQSLQSDNRIVAGSWWSGGTAGQPQLSVEEGIASTLNIHLGDTLTYGVAGDTFRAKVVNLRKVDWDSFRVNFFVIAAPGLLERFPASYVTSFHVPGGSEALLDDLVKSFPNFTVIDVAAVMAQIRSMMDRVAGAVEFVFVFTWATGFIVLYAAIASTRDERLYEAATLRVLGASRKQLLAGMFAEFAGIGLMSGFIAAAGATALSYALSTRLLHLPYVFNPWLWIVAAAGGAVGVGIAGLLGTRGILNRPPLQTIREVA
jgi:putative ABC transport system permease protein